jgi:hypothetical protein
MHFAFAVVFKEGCPYLSVLVHALALVRSNLAVQSEARSSSTRSVQRWHGIPQYKIAAGDCNQGQKENMEATHSEESNVAGDL